MNRSTAAAAMLAAAVLAGCASSGQAAAPKAAAPAASPLPQWCADAHTVAGEILTASGLDAGSLRTWDNDTSRVSHEADKAFAGSAAAQDTANAANAIALDVLKADLAAEGQLNPAKAPGLLKFRADARTLQRSCGGAQ